MALEGRAIQEIGGARDGFGDGAVRCSERRGRKTSTCPGMSDVKVATPAVSRWSIGGWAYGYLTNAPAHLPSWLRSRFKLSTSSVEPFFSTCATLSLGSNAIGHP
jgi:hypothetical protein